MQAKPMKVRENKAWPNEGTNPQGWVVNFFSPARIVRTDQIAPKKNKTKYKIEKDTTVLKMRAIFLCASKEDTKSLMPELNGGLGFPEPNAWTKMVA